MAHLDKIAIHHSGPIGTSALSSSAHLTAQDVNTAHKNRWAFPSQYIEGQYGGYNVIYDPKTREFHQYRAIGEETAAQRGFNFDTFSLCIIGNYNLKPDGTPVDVLKPHAMVDVVNFLVDICKGNVRGLVVAPDSSFKFAPEKIYPHRFFSQTDCYGTSIDDSFFKAQVQLRYYPNIGKLEKLIGLIRNILFTLKIHSSALGSQDRECDGCVY